MRFDEESQCFVIDSPLFVYVGKKKFMLNMNDYRNAHYQVLNKAKVEYKRLLRDEILQLPKMNVVNIDYEITLGTDKTFICENCSSKINKEIKELVDYNDIDSLCNHILSLYPFDGEIMAFQAQAKLECGHEEDAMKLYNESINNTRNGLIWQKVEDESGISRIEIESELIKMIDD